MKRIFCFVAIACLLFGACKKESLNTNQQARPTNDVTQAASLNAAFSFNTQSDIDLTLPGWYEVNSCTGEHLHINSGTWHIDVHGVINNNNKVSFAKHTNTNNYKLVSLSTGIEYTGSFVSNTDYSSTFTNGLFTATSTLSVLLTTPGGSNNSVLKADEHITINANGVLTAYLDNFRSGCQ
jgi:hypothetical protein